MSDIREQPRCIIMVRKGSGRVGIRRQAQHVETGEWLDFEEGLVEFPPDCNGILTCYFGRLERLAPEGMNIRLIFEEMPQ